MVNQIQKRRDNASIHRPSPSLSLIFSLLFPSLSHSFIHIHSSSVTPSFPPFLPLSFFLSSSFLSLPHFLPVVPENRRTEIGCDSGLFKSFQGPSTLAAAAAGCVAMETVLCRSSNPPNNAMPTGRFLALPPLPPSTFLF